MIEILQSGGLAIVISIFVALATSRLITWCIAWHKNPLRKLPGPKGSFWLGNIAEFSPPNDARKAMIKWARTYGDMYKTWSPVYGNRVHLQNPEHIKKILVTDSKHCERPSLLAKIMGDPETTLFNSNGKTHASQRRMLNPLFSLGNIQKFIPIFNTKVDQLIKVWTQEIDASAGPYHEAIQKRFTNVTLDIIGVCAFGYEFDCTTSGHSKESYAIDTILRGQFDLKQRALEFTFPLLKLIPSKERRKVQEAKDISTRVIQKVIRERRAEIQVDENNGSERKDILHSLLQMKDDDGHKLNDKDLQAQVGMFMVAGHETTSTTMTWTILLLAKHQDLQDRARREIRRVMDGKDEITWDEIKNMTFLDNCIKESMRLYPAALFVGRELLQDISIGDVLLPKGTVVNLGIAECQSELGFWKDADTYNPDRYEEEGLKSNPSSLTYRLLPFSRGPRMCIGYRLAEAEMKVVLAKLLHKFTFKLNEDQPNEEIFHGEMVLTYRPSFESLVEISTAA